jgi:hypothetical protein
MPHNPGPSPNLTVGALDGVGGMPLAVIAAEEQQQKQEDVFSAPLQDPCGVRAGPLIFRGEISVFPKSGNALRIFLVDGFTVNVNFW